MVVPPLLTQPPGSIPVRGAPAVYHTVLGPGGTTETRLSFLPPGGRRLSVEKKSSNYQRGVRVVEKKTKQKTRGLKIKDNEDRELRIRSGKAL